MPCPAWLIFAAFVAAQQRLDVVATQQMAEAETRQPLAAVTQQLVGGETPQPHVPVVDQRRVDGVQQLDREAGHPRHQQCRTLPSLGQMAGNVRTAATATLSHWLVAKLLQLPQDKARQMQVKYQTTQKFVDVHCLPRVL